MFDDQKDNDFLDNNQDEFVDSSFMVSFKANESTTVSDKIKEGNSSMDDLFKDEFDDFDFDPTKSAFKPLNSTAVTPTPTPASVPEEPKQPLTPFGNVEVPKANDSAFSDADIDFNEFTNNAPASNVNNNVFSAGLDLDFAASTNSNSNFANNNDALNLEIEADHVAASPFKPVVAPQIEENKIDNSDDEPKKTQEAGNIKTYGKVSSGVNAFARPAAAKAPEKKPAPIAEAKTEQVVSDNKPSTPNPVQAQPVQPQVKEEEKDAAPSPFINKANVTEEPKTAPSPFANNAKPVQEKTEAPSPFVKKGEANRPIPPSSNVARVAPASKPNATRPVASRPQTTQNTAPKAPSSHSANANIAPVQVNKKQSKKMAKADKPVKEPGKGGLIGLIVVLGAIFVLLWVADNYKNWFGSSDETTATTQVTAVATTEEVPVVDETETTTEATTEATTEETTEATTETTIEETEETTVETSEETTATTTEETTTATTTTEATTEATTTRAPSTTSGEVHARYSIANPRTTSDGFHFDIAVTNTGNNNFSVSQLDELEISFTTSSTITSLTSDYFTFTPGDEPNSFIGRPRSGSFPAGETTNCTITAVTESSVQHFYIANYHFDWN